MDDENRTDDQHQPEAQVGEGDGQEHTGFEFAPGEPGTLDSEEAPEELPPPAPEAEAAAPEDAPAEEEPAAPEPDAEAPPAEPAAAPAQPTAPAPTIGTEQPVAVEGGGQPLPVLDGDRIHHPLGKRGRRAAERAERHVAAAGVVEEEPEPGEADAELLIAARVDAEERGLDYDALTDEERAQLLAQVREERGEEVPA